MVVTPPKTVATLVAPTSTITTTALTPVTEQSAASTSPTLSQCTPNSRCQGKAMDAKAVADRIYKEHSIVATEEEVLHAQAWLQEELKLNETPPATEKKAEVTAPATLPVTPPVQPTAPVQPPVTPPVNVPPDGGGRVGAVPAASEQPTDLPDVLKAARSLTDEQIISSLELGS